MVDSTISNALQPFQQGLSAGTNTGFGTGWIVGISIFIGLAIFSLVGALIWYYFWDKKKWNITTRVHYENPTINGVSMGSAVPTKRVRFKDGRVVYMYKLPIQGYTISPELLTWTRPREHDVIVTQDKKLFGIIGINSIDVQRKKLNVDINYPDIEMDRQDLQQHIDSKKFDDPNERFKIIAKAVLWVFGFIAIIVVSVIAGKTYIDAKNIDAQRDNINLQVSANQVKVLEGINTFLAILRAKLPATFTDLDGKNLINQLNITTNTTV